MALLGFSA